MLGKKYTGITYTNIITSLYEVLTRISVIPRTATNLWYSTLKDEVGHGGKGGVSSTQSDGDK